MGIKVGIRYREMCKLNTSDKYDCIGIIVKNQNLCIAISNTSYNSIVNVIELYITNTYTSYTFFVLFSLLTTKTKIKRHIQKNEKSCI